MDKVIFIDIDGTLLDYENKLPASADSKYGETALGYCLHRNVLPNWSVPLQLRVRISSSLLPGRSLLKVRRMKWH